MLVHLLLQQRHLCLCLVKLPLNRLCQLSALGLNHSSQGLSIESCQLSLGLCCLLSGSLKLHHAGSKSHLGFGPLLFKLGHPLPLLMHSPLLLVQSP